MSNPWISTPFRLCPGPQQVAYENKRELFG